MQVWVSLKGFVCCDVLNSLGSTWTGLIACASCGLGLLLLVFIWIGRQAKRQGYARAPTFTVQPGFNYGVCARPCPAV